MSLSSGDHVGAYEVISLLGAGGMGQVYRARDTRLNRDVALKVLPESFALDPDRLARFSREAQVLASLNHQNIATIHGIEEANGTKTLILELVDGPTLADRIAQGPIPYDEALPIAKQIAAALEAAHERGIIHRDLKPANIKLRPDGTVKVLDFGLAKACDPSTAPSDASHSPTLSLTGVSRIGVVLGTAAYMAPEQARGRVVDRRADIWAFGCVFYEMLTGRQAFPGDDVSQTLARVIERDPDWRLLPNTVPPLVRTFLRRSLEKDAARRTRDIGDIRLVMDGAFDEAGLSLGESTISIPTWRRSLPWAAGVALGALIGISVWAMRPSVAPGEITRFELNLPNLHNGGGPLVTISQDGRTLFYVENQRGLSRILQRGLSELSWQAVPGTEGAETAPFFSPDGNWMGFTTENLRTIKRVPHVGGSPVTVSRRSSAIFSPVWAPDGTIIFGSNSGLWRVSQDGGSPELIANTEGIAGGPQVLPDGRHVVFHVAPSGAPDYTIEVLTLDTGERRQITTGVYPLYAAGHLVFTRDDGSLWTVGFDASRVQTVGEPIPLPITAFRRGAGNLAPQYALGRNGTLVHIPTLEGTGTTLAWVDRGGNLTASRLPPAAYSYPRLSHDGKRLSVGIAGDIWVIDLERSGRNRLTSGDRAGARSLAPITAWSPDGKRVTFYRASQDPSKPYATTLEWRMADATTPSEILWGSDGTAVPGFWSRDGSTLLFQHFFGPPTSANRDLWVLRPLVKSAHPWLTTAAAERAPVLSPDEKWMAYVSDESGTDQIYVQAYPGPGERHTVSVDGGSEPLWSRNGRELFYRNADAMLSVSVTTTAASRISLGQPLKLFEGAYLRDTSNARAHPNYDVTADGRFLMLAAPPLSNARLVVVEDWFEELKRLAPAR